jgi:hypothetical protein
MHVHPIGAISAAAVLVAAFAALMIRLRCSRDRRTISADLERRRCRLISATLALRHFYRPGGRTYHVEYVDFEEDLAQTTARVARGGAVSWGDDVGDTSALVGFAHDLPTYGQNWRG